MKKTVLAMMAVALLCGAAMVSCTEKLEELPEAKSTVASPDNPSTTPDNQTYGEWYYVPLEELLTGEWEMDTVSGGQFDYNGLVNLYSSYYNEMSSSIFPWFHLTTPGLHWKDFVPLINIDRPGGCPSHISITGDTIHTTYFIPHSLYIDGSGRYYTEEHLDWLFEVIDECRIQLTPLSEGMRPARSEQDYKAFILSLDNDCFATPTDADNHLVCGYIDQADIVFFRRVR